LNYQTIKNDFLQVISLIQTARYRAMNSVNSELVNLYWQVGQFVSMQLKKATWGDGTVNELAQYIQKHHPEIKGFDKKNLYRMCQFYQTYNDIQLIAPLVRQSHQSENMATLIVAPVVRQLNETVNDLNDIEDIRNTLLAKISWSHHLIIMGRCKTSEEREFYIRLFINEHYSKRELDRQISSSVFERVMLGNSKFPDSIRHLPQDMTNTLKDSYVFEFINLPEPYIENDLRKALLNDF
jgi:predicted nuclease of restriction endonuclease-like (RecB) superfamily